MQSDILDGGPDNGQATVLGGEDVNLIGALPHEAPQTLNSIGRLNGAVHALASTQKRSTGALRPQPGFVPLLDTACCI
jgi:hypothetical protein